MIALNQVNVEEISIILCFGLWCLQHEIRVCWSPLGFLTTQFMIRCLNLLDQQPVKKNISQLHLDVYLANVFISM